MLSFLEDMKALNVQNRTVAVIENGSWAIRSGDLISEFLDEQMKTMTVLNDRLTIASRLKDGQEEELDGLALSIKESMRG